MIKFLSVVAILMTSFRLSAQVLKVFDETNLEPILNVLVYSSESLISEQTNSKGSIDFSSFTSNDVISFQHPSYQRASFSYQDIVDNKYRIYLKERIIEIGGVVVSANKWEEDKSEIPNEIASISPKQIEFRNPQTAADMLESSGQVFIQKSQLGGGSPIMRGFAANAILIVFDGIRMNNAIFRGGNLQNVIQIDPNMLKGAEVVFGPGSVIYGSDALGGVMDFHTIDPAFSLDNKPLVFGQVFSRYSSANNEKTGNFKINIGGKNLSSITSVSFSDYDDLRTGSNRTSEFPDFGKRTSFVKRVNGEDVIVENDDENIQRASGFWQNNLLQKIKWRPNDFMDLEYQLYFSTSSDIPRYDRLIQVRDGLPRSAEWHYGPQRFLLNALKWSIFRKTKLFDQSRLTLSYQDFQESRHDRGFQDTGLRHRTEDLNIFTFNLDFDKVINPKNQLFYGLEFNHNDVSSSAFEENIDTGVLSAASTRYPNGGNTYQSFAAYLSHKWSISKKWIVSTGTRYSFVRLKSSFNDDQFFNFPFEDLKINNGAINGSLGIVFRPSERTKLNGLFSTGFRAPNVDDAGKVFDSEPGNVVVPNGNLKPEYTYNFEFGVTKRFADKVQLNSVVFYTILDNAIVRRNFVFNGQDSIIYDGLLSRVQAEVNVGEAYIYGFSVSIKSDITNHLALFSSLTYTNGEDKVENVPLRHTTPLFGQTSLTYSAKKVKAELYFKYNGKREFEELPPEEQSKTHLYTTNGSLGWFTTNLRGSYQISTALQLNGGIENLFDKHYRPYSSGISAPGRNFILALRASF